MIKTKTGPGLWLLYSKGVASGGATVLSSNEGGGGTQTSSSGGGTSRSTASGGGGGSTTSNNEERRSTTDVQSMRPGTGLDSTAGGGSDNHAHLLYPHGHYIDIPGHRHDFMMREHGHDFSIPNHKHSLSFPNHKHSTHIPDHTHDMEHGIYMGPTPTAVEVRVDGNLIPGLGLSEDGVDIVPYLEKDADGKIVRGWHEVTVTPDGLGRVAASIFMQMFVQSRGGGDY